MLKWTPTGSTITECVVCIDTSRNEIWIGTKEEALNTLHEITPDIVFVVDSNDPTFKLPFILSSLNKNPGVNNIDEYYAKDKSYRSQHGKAEVHQKYWN